MGSPGTLFVANGPKALQDRAQGQEESADMIRAKPWWKLSWPAKNPNVPLSNICANGSKLSEPLAPISCCLISLHTKGNNNTEEIQQSFIKA